MMALAPLTVQCMPARLSRVPTTILRSEEHTSELQSRLHLVCRLLLEKKNAFVFTPKSTLIPPHVPYAFTPTGRRSVSMPSTAARSASVDSRVLLGRTYACASETWHCP